tara:strand:- start:7462 stop:7821 length:360 start_codon:yes stop_codon:yes gene_type:complete
MTPFNTNHIYISCDSQNESYSAIFQHPTRDCNYVAKGKVEFDISPMGGTMAVAASVLSWFTEYEESDMPKPEEDSPAGCYAKEAERLLNKELLQELEDEMYEDALEHEKSELGFDALYG